MIFDFTEIKQVRKKKMFGNQWKKVNNFKNAC